MTPEERALRLASGRATAATKERDRLIRDLRDQGFSLRAVANIAGLSHTAIAKICNRETKP